MSFENQNRNIMPNGAFGNEANQNGNMSGRGSVYPVPDVVANHFNWGAFLLNWIWGLGNKSYIALVALALGFVPFIGGIASLAFCIWLGIKGNELAWQNKYFPGINEFHEYQKKWAIAGIIVNVILLPLFIIGIIAALTLPALMTDTTAQQDRTAKLKALNTIYEATQMNQALGTKCKLSSKGLARCFAERMSGDRTANIITTSDDMIWTFKGNGICMAEGDCNVTIQVNPTRSATTMEIPLYVNSEGFIYVKKTDTDKYSK